MPESGHYSGTPADLGPATPLTYAIGDIHGSLPKLRRLIAQCEQHAAGHPATFVFLGDYIDRGPQSAGVIRFVIDLQFGQTLPAHNWFAASRNRQMWSGVVSHSNGLDARFRTSCRKF